MQIIAIITYVCFPIYPEVIQRGEKKREGKMERSTEGETTEGRMGKTGGRGATNLCPRKEGTKRKEGKRDRCWYSNK